MKSLSCVTPVADHHRVLVAALDALWSLPPTPTLLSCMDSLVLLIDEWERGAETRPMVAGGVSPP